MEKLLKRDSFFVILIIVLSSLAFKALFVPGFFGVSDDIHIGWLYEMDRTLKLGQFPPRFVPDLSYSFGYPLFNFVFPLPFYIGELFHLTGLNFVDSLKAVFFISVPLSGIGMYFLLRQFTNMVNSLVGSMLYIYAPYRAVDLYVRGAIGEITAFIFFPLLALAVVKITNETELKRLKWFSLGGITLAGLVLSHNIATYMFMPFILLLGMLRIIFLAKKKTIALINFIMLIFLGLICSAYFWIPALIDSGLMKYDTVFNFADHFPTLLQLVKPYWGYGASVPGPYDGMSFFLGVSSLILIVLAVLLIFIKNFKFELETKLMIIWSVISLVIVIFMMNFRSSLLWSSLPLLPYFQFPWRFLMMTSFFIPLLVVSLNKFKYANYFAISLLVVTLAINFSYFRPQDFLGRKDDYYLNRYIPYPVASEDYKLTQEEYLRLPNNTKQRPDKNYPLVYGERDFNLSTTNVFTTNLEIILDKNQSIYYSKYLFPGWEAKIDNQQVKISPGEKFGDIKIDMPAGKHNLQIIFQETNFKKLLDLISLIGLGISLYFVFKSYRHEKS